MMASKTFDPYHKWLGIPPHEQPPSHYRLLRISEFESDQEVIELAYEKEMGALKRHEYGEYVGPSRGRRSKVGDSQEVPAGC